MNSHTIDAKTFQKLFLAGANRINSRKDYINELNVFPVPDGDTGTNMSLTILAVTKLSSTSFSIRMCQTKSHSKSICTIIIHASPSLGKIKKSGIGFQIPDFFV